MNLPNKISLIRISFIPIFMFFLLSPLKLGTVKISTLEIQTSILIALFIFILASATDWIDGYIARKYNMVTNLGKFLDPLADKLLMTAGFVALVEMQLAPAWMIILILSREIAVTGLRLVAAQAGVVIAADKSGKIKTVIQIITVIVVLLNLHSLLNEVLLWASTIVTVYSGIEYFRANRHLFKNAD